MVPFFGTKYMGMKMNVRLRHDMIIRALRRSSTATVAELAETVSVSRRTVLRDIGALREQGFIIDTEPGPGGGVQIDPQSIQTTTRLSVPEIFALLLSVATMRAARSLPFSDLADSGLAKIEQSLPQDKLRDLRRFLSRLYVGQIPRGEDISDVGGMDSALLPAFETAFLQNLRLRFQYKDAKGRVTTREVEPQAMLILPPLWYLVAWDPLRDDFRHFRMDRITQPEHVPGVKFRTRHVPFADDVCPYQAMT
jgi:predicted DNA-binding transcriptional regulator YafY